MRRAMRSIVRRLTAHTSGRGIGWLACALTLAACGTSSALPTPTDAPVMRDAGAEDVAVDTGPCNGGPRQGPGGACQCTADCEPGATCATEGETGFPGGMCLRPCDPAEAPRAGLTCRELDGGTAYIPTCGGDAGAPCRDGWFCRVYTGATRAQDRYECDPRCERDEQCATGHCNRYTGFCQPDADARANGEACTVGEQCRSGQCLRSGLGACNSLCDVRSGFCPDDGFCLPPVQAATGAQNGTCLARCARLADCRMGFTCMRYMGQGLCVPNSL